MARDRDSQRKKFFAAIKVLGFHSTLFADMPEVRSYIYSLNNKPTLARRYPNDALNFLRRRVEIRDGRGYGRAVASPEESWVTFPCNSRNDVDVLRSMAFIIAYRHHGPNIAWHGWEYCSTLMDLVRFMLGEQSASDLKTSFDKHNVRYTKPSTRTLTKEQKATLSARGERLAAIMRDRRSRKKFSERYPEAPIISDDEFGDDWEDLYRMWRP